MIRRILAQGAAAMTRYCAGLATAGVLILAAANGFPTISAQPQAASGQWEAKAPMPQARNEVAAVAVNGKLYVIGGASREGGYELTTTEEYDPASDTWRARAPMLHGLNHVGAAVLDGKIYVVGGFIRRSHGGAQNRAMVYDPQTDSWRDLPPMKGPRGSVAVAAAAGKIHAFGGRLDEAHMLTTHEAYDPANNTWSEAAPLSRARDHMAAVTADGKIHVIGGRFGANEDMAGLHEIYDPARDAWSKAADVPTPRGGGAGTLYKNYILFLGAEDDKRTYAENEAFDIRKGTWAAFAPMPKGRHGMGAAAIGDVAYVAGGALGRGGRDMTNALLAFTLPK
jgi:N-acetylneuraminic acid mutarotase